MVVTLVLLCAVLAGAIGGLIFHFAHQQNASDTVVRTLTVAAPPTLTIDVDAGSVRVIAGGASEVRVTITRHAANAYSDDARRDLARIGVDVRQVGNDIAVTARVPQTVDPGLSLAADVALAVPPQSEIAVRLGNGSAQLDGMHGVVNASVTSGNLQLSDMTLLGQSSLNVRDGDATVAGWVAPQANVQVHVQSGDASITLANGDLVKVSASTQHGDVTVEGWNAAPQHVGDGASVAGIVGAQTAPATAAAGTLLVSVGAGEVSIRVR